MIIKNLTKNFYINLFIIFSIFIIDRITKIYVVSVNGKNSYEDLYSSKFLNIHLIWNEGIAFGLLSFNQNNLYNLLTLIISIIVIVILKMIINSYGIKKYGLMMIFGGALGNLYDRLTYHAVPDFIDIHYKSFHWFTFNMADIFITTGIIMLLVKELFIKNEKN